MSSEPRLLVLTPDFPPAPGGIQLLVARIVQHVERLRPRVLTVGGPGTHEYDAAHDLDVRRVRGQQRRAIAALNAVALAQAARFRPAVVLSAHIVTAPAAAAIRAALRVPVVQYLYAEELGNRPALTAFALRRADGAVAISRYTHELALKAGADAARVQLIPPGVDIPDQPLTQARATRPTLLTVARIGERYKGHDVVLRALPLIRARVPDVEWVVIGDGPLRPGLERAARDQGLQDAVRFLGRVCDAERDRWLARAHLFTMPSRVPGGRFAGEGFGIVYLEAGAHGLPVVAGSEGGAVDAVVHGETGLLVDPTNHVAVAEAIADLLIDRDRARRFGTAGARRAREFAWPVVAHRVEDLVLGLLDGSLARGPRSAGRRTT